MTAMADLRLFGKTPKGTAELAARSGALSLTQRRLLILVDGVRDVGQLGAVVTAGLEEALQALEQGGYIVLHGHNTRGADTVQPPSVTIPASDMTTVHEAKLRAARAVTELLGPAADELAMAIEAARTGDELRPLVREAERLVNNALGAAAAQAFIRGIRRRHAGGASTPFGDTTQAPRPPRVAMEFPQSICYLNGDWLALADAKVSVLDRGFIFGDGIYEVVPVYYHQPFRFDHHLARFERSTREIGLANPFDRAGWRALVERLIATCADEHQFVYWQVTRGVAKRDFSFPANTAPTVFAMTTPFTRPSRAQRELGLSAVTRADERWLRCDIKSVSLLGAVLARQFGTERGADEVVQFRDGWLTEGSSSNIWVVRNGTVIAPPRDRLILEGIRYGLVGELCGQAGVPFEVRRLRQDEVTSSDELMLTSATREILPIVNLDGRAVGSGRPGPVYARLRAAYDAAIESLRSP